MSSMSFSNREMILLTLQVFGGEFFSKSTVPEKISEQSAWRLRNRRYQSTALE